MNKRKEDCCETGTERTGGQAAGIGIKSGIIASACCIIPLILVVTFVSIGVGSVTLALSLAQYRPYFIALGSAFLLVSLYLYFKRKYGRCDLNVIGRNIRFLLMTITIFITVFSTTSYVILPILSQPLYSTLPGLSTTTQTTDTPRIGLHEVTLNVGGMTCSSCADGIKYALKQKIGVIEAKITYPEGTGIVTYDPSKITDKEISQTIIELGYSAEIVQDKIR